jgi:hypothetical protein
MHALLDRQPIKHVLSLPADVSAPPSIRGDYRIVHWRPSTPLVEFEGLPVWAIESLLVAMAAHPTSYRDWANVLDLIPQAVAKVRPEILEEELRSQPLSVRTKTAYLLKRGGADRDLLGRIDQQAQERRPLIYFGPRNRPARIVKEYNVRDSLLLQEW